MKKTLLSVIAGLAVINAASAVPSISDRRALCEKHPDKYVWVDKTQACVRIDPCSAIDMPYCIDAYDVNKPEDSYARLLIERYVKNLMRANVREIKYLGDSKYAFKTDDLDYRVIEFGNNDNNLALGAACWAYGKEIDIKYEIKNYSEEMVRVTSRGRYVLCKNVTRSECTNIGDFARLLDEEGMQITTWQMDKENSDYYQARANAFSAKDILNKVKAEKEGLVHEYFEDGDCLLMKL